MIQLVPTIHKILQVSKTLQIHTMGGVPMGAILKDFDKMGEEKNNTNNFHR